MEEKTPRGLKHGPLSAIIVFLFEIVCAIVVFSFLQRLFGMWGLVATELGILAIAVIAALVFNVGFAEMFPIKKIKVNQFFGTMIMWLGSIILMMIINLAFFFFFPEGMNVGAELNSFFAQWPVLASMIVVAVLPAICEESLHRGFILSGMKRKIHNKWALCIIMGILFGLFHMDFYRFIGTGILGGVMTYILLETDNFLLNMFFHFLNNFIIQGLTVFSTEETIKEASQTLTRDMLPMSFASYCILGFLAPMLIAGGSMLLKGKKKLKEEGKVRITSSIIFAVVCSGIIFLTGFVLMSYIIFNGLMEEMI